MVIQIWNYNPDKDTKEKLHYTLETLWDWGKPSFLILLEILINFTTLLRASKIVILKTSIKLKSVRSKTKLAKCLCRKKYGGPRGRKFIGLEKMTGTPSFFIKEETIIILNLSLN